MSDGSIIIDTRIDNSGANRDMDRLRQQAQNSAEEVQDIIEDTADEATDKVEFSTNKIEQVVTKSVKALVASIGAISLASLKVADDYQKACNQFQVATGITKDDMGEFSEIIKNVYGNNFGESFEDVANSLSQVRTNLWLTGDELQNTTEYALGFKDAFDIEVNESTRAAKALMDNFGLSSKEAFNMLTQGYQEGLNYSDEFIDTVNEYSVQFQKLGFDVEDMFSILDSGTQAGAWNLDKIGDAVKELSIRVIDGSDTTKEGFETLGFNADEMAQKFGAGGESAKEAFNQVIEGLANCDDPIKQNLAGTDLLGTMWEDLGPQVVTSLSTANDYFDKTADSIEELNKIKYDDLGSAISGIWRMIQTNLLLPIGESLLPAFSDMANGLKDAFNSEEMQGKIKKIIDSVGEMGKAFADAVETFLPKLVDGFSWIIDHAEEIGLALTIIGSALVAIKIGNGITNAISAIQGLGSLSGVLSAIASPVVLVVAGIVALVGAIVYLWNTNEDFRNFILDCWEGIKNFIGSVVDAIVNFFTETLPNAFDSVVDFFSNVGQSIIDGISWAIDGIVKFFTETIPNAIQSTINWFLDLPNKIGYALGFAIGSVINWGVQTYNYLVSNVPKWIEAVVKWFGQLPDKIWNWLVQCINNIINWGSQTYNNAINWVSNTINSVVDWFSQLPSRIWNWLVNAINNVISWGSHLASAGYNAASQLVSSVVSTISSIPGKMVSIGKNIVEGIWDGISGAAGWLWDKVTGFASSIVDGFKDALGIHSPSRVMADMIGKFIPPGIGEGVSKEMPNLSKQLNANIDDLYRDLRVNVDLNTALTTSQIVTSTNYTIASNNEPTGGYNEATGGSKDGVVIHNIVKLDGRTIAETTAPYTNTELGKIQGLSERGGC
ncbi:MAG: phage tail tape measure protein [Bacilli bacterium]